MTARAPRTWLVFLKQEFAAPLRDGTKRLEIRAGARYEDLRAGDRLSINGQFRLRIARVERYETRTKLLQAVGSRHELTGCASPRLLRQALVRCYPARSVAPWFVLELRRE